MADMKTDAPLAALIGDVVRSRSAEDRSALHARLVELLEQANEVLAPVVELRITVGDEFQGCFATVGEALHASLWLRLHAAPDVDLRHGVGWGSVAVLAADPRVEDGPAWWSARDAIEEVKAEAARSATRHLRTAYRRAEEAAAAEGPDPGALNAALMCRDQMVGSLSERSVRLLRGTLEGRTQAELAAAEDISASAVSQRMRHDGLAVIVAADELMRKVR